MRHAGEQKDRKPHFLHAPYISSPVLHHDITEAGEVLDWEGEQRMIAASPEQMRQTPLCIDVAATPEKAAAIIGAVRSGMSTRWAPIFKPP